jgi:hypothetical protein
MAEPQSEQLAEGESVEVEPGVVVERRSFLTLAATALAALTLPGSALAQTRDRSTPLTFDEFLQDVVPVAKRLVTDVSPTGQDRYLLTLASYAVRLSEVPIPEEWRDSKQGARPGTWIGFNPGGDPFVVLHWRMEPGTEIRTHAHTYGNVFTLGLEGSVRVRNYEMLGERDFLHPVASTWYCWNTITFTVSWPGNLAAEPLDPALQIYEGSSTS